MNSYELTYMHYTRSRELIAQAERERLARIAGKSSRKGLGGLTARFGKARGRGKAPVGGLQPAK